MVREHHQLSGHEFEQTLRDSKGQGSLAYCGPWGCRVRPNLATEHTHTHAQCNLCVISSNENTKRIL